MFCFVRNDRRTLTIPPMSSRHWYVGVGVQYVLSTFLRLCMCGFRRSAPRTKNCLPKSRPSKAERYNNAPRPLKCSFHGSWGAHTRMKPQTPRRKHTALYPHFTLISKGKHLWWLYMRAHLRSYHAAAVHHGRHLAGDPTTRPTDARAPHTHTHTHTPQKVVTFHAGKRRKPP